MHNQWCVSGGNLDSKYDNDDGEIVLVTNQKRNGGNRNSNKTCNRVTTKFPHCGKICHKEKYCWEKQPEKKPKKFAEKDKTTTAVTRSDR
jgi:hypothetical protein